MKKNLLLYFAAFAAILTVSCSREVVPDQDRPFKDGETGLIMRVRSTAPNTRLIPAPAENALNEDVLEQFYYFFYTVDPSLAANAAAVPVYAGKWTAPEGETVTGTGTEENIVLDKLNALKVSDTKYAGYVYVIANYKDEIVLADWDAIIAAATPDYSTLTWNYFQNLSLPATFQSYDIVGGDEIMNEKQDEGHRFKPQDSFVMDSAPTFFEVTKGTVGTIDAPLERLAVKINLEIHMAKWFVQRNNGAYKNTWYSDPSRIQIYLNYAADKGVMSGTPITYENASDFFTYRRFSFLSNWTKSGDDYVFPDGSYHEKEPLKWILDAEKAAQPQPVEGQYYTADEDEAGKIVEIGEEIQYREYARPAYLITGTPFYTYPYDFSGDSGHAPFFKVIVEWTGYNESAGTIATDEEEGTKDVPEVIAREFFYKITIPDGLFEKATPKVFQANHWYTIRLNLSTLGSEADETAIDVSSDTYFVTNWSDPLTPDKPDINAGRYLSITSLETEENKPVYHMYGSELEIPVATSHAISVENVSVTYKTFTTTPAGTATLPASSYTITPGHDNVVVEHDVVSDLSSVSAQDISVITYKFTVRHSDEAGSSYKQDVIVYQYPPIYIQKREGGNVFIDGFFQYLDGKPTGFSNPVEIGNTGHYRSASYGGTVFQYPTNYPNGTVSTSGSLAAVTSPYGYINMDNLNAETETTLVTVSTFDSSSETFTDRLNGNGTSITYHYKIMDPRVDNTWTTDLVPYLTGQSATSGTVTLYHEDWDNQSAIKVGSGLISVGTNEYNAPIAPAFLITSRYGRPGGNGAVFPTTLEQAQQRCATYQEAGYPAGRWRLPTDAEAYFVYTLQDNGLMQQLFTTSGYGYWTSSGRRFGGDNTGGVTGAHFHSGGTASSGGSISVRCVYDIWYWGDKTVDKHKFTPQP